MISRVKNLIQKIKTKSIKDIFIIVFKYKFPKFLERVISVFFYLLKLKNVIVFESTNDFAMNSGTLYDYIIKQGYNKDYKIVWFVRSRQKYDLPNNVITVPLYGASIKRVYYNSIAKYLIYENEFLYKRKKDQISIYLTHGTRSLKNSKGLITLPKDVDYVVSASPYNDSLSQQIYGCSMSKFVHCGMPITDLFFESWDELKKLGINRNNYSKVIIWMPTLRKSKYDKHREDFISKSNTGLPVIADPDEFNMLNAYLTNRNALLIIKIHPMQDLREIHVKSLSNILIWSADYLLQNKINNYKILTQTDALISDFSSISFDYILLDKPIGYDFSEINDYKIGIIEDVFSKETPGEYIYNVKDLLAYINDVCNGVDRYKNERNELCKNVHKNQDGLCCQRIVKLLGL